MVDALVIGAGPAGLMAAEELALAGRRVVICEAKPSVGRKFLMAGKSGLNITMERDIDAFSSVYDPWLAPILAEFGPDEVMGWCRGLGVEVFSGSSGRVFPVGMKGSPLLRAWCGRLAGLGVEFRTKWRWSGFEGAGFRFQCVDSVEIFKPEVTVLALGGASWARLGSDAAWVPWLVEKDVGFEGFKPANMGFLVGWSGHMERFFGAAVKGVALLVGENRERGEFIISSKGLEGGGIYAVSRALREGGVLRLDLMPDVAEAEVLARLGRMQGKETLANRLRKLGISAVGVALVMEFGRDLPIIEAIKRLPVKTLGPRPLDEAISVAGGVKRSSLSEGLELLALPRVYACGEMLDWEAPTGGYLLTGCLATGRWAGRHAAG